MTLQELGYKTSQDTEKETVYENRLMRISLFHGYQKVLFMAVQPNKFYSFSMAELEAVHQECGRLGWLNQPAKNETN